MLRRDASLLSVPSPLPASIRSLRSPVWIATIRPAAGRTIRSFDLRLQLRNPDPAIFCSTYSLLQDLDAVHEDCPAWHVSADRLEQRVAVLMPGNRSPDANFIPNEFPLADRPQKLLEQFRVNISVAIQRPHRLRVLLALKISDQQRRLGRTLQVELEADAVNVAGCYGNHLPGDCWVICLVSASEISRPNLDGIVRHKPHPVPRLWLRRNDTAGGRF